MQTQTDKQEEIGYNKGQTYEQISEYIERCFRIYPLESYFSHIINYLNTPDIKILELGCGNGFLSLWLEKRLGIPICGLDISKEFIETANRYSAEHGYKSRFVVGDAENTGIEAESFDVIITMDTLHHFPDTGDILKEVYHVLKPNGLFIIFEPNPLNPYTVYSVIKAKIQNGGYGYDHERMFGRGHYIQHFKTSGFKIIENKTIRYIPKSIIDESKCCFRLDKIVSNIPIINFFGFSTFICALKGTRWF